MQVKYIVYYPSRNKPPKVALWLTSDGSMTHVKYMQEHQISPQSLSSLGYIYYSPFGNEYKLEHYHNDVVDSCLDFFKKLRLQKRDRLLVHQEISRSRFLQESHVKQGTYQDQLLFQKVKNNLRAC